MPGNRRPMSPALRAWALAASLSGLTALAGLAGLAALASADAATTAQQSLESAGSSSQTSKSKSLDEVTVTATREKELARKVTKFVNQIAVPENGGNSGLARWQAPPVCPLVSGLSRRDGEFILERVSQIGRGAGVPLAGDQCHPNLYILVTPQPADLLRGMEKRNRGFTFGYDTSSYPPMQTPAGVVDEFIKTPRAVRVWYDSAEKNAWGKPLAYCPMTELCNPASKDCAPPPPSYYARYYQCGSGVAGGTHLAFNTIWTFSRVFIIVDRTRLRGVKLGQLADYVAMVAFAKVKPGAHLGDAPTILKLFDGAPQAAPVGMTEWDQTFLKSLYATEQKSMLQRGEIAGDMVHDIAHRK